MRKELRAELDDIKTEQRELDRYSLQGDRLKREIERAQSQLEEFQDENNRLKSELENAPSADRDEPQSRGASRTKPEKENHDVRRRRHGCVWAVRGRDCFL